MELEELAIKVQRFMVANDKMHVTYGSTTTCYGGIGGQAMTPHCSHLCHNPIHKADVDEWNAAYRDLRHYMEENR